MQDTIPGGQPQTNASRQADWKQREHKLYTTQARHIRQSPDRKKAVPSHMAASRESKDQETGPASVACNETDSKKPLNTSAPAALVQAAAEATPKCS
jgi:hypothetical protein